MPSLPPRRGRAARDAHDDGHHSAPRPRLGPARVRPDGARQEPAARAQPLRLPDRHRAARRAARRARVPDRQRRPRTAARRAEPGRRHAGAVDLAAARDDERGGDQDRAERRRRRLQRPALHLGDPRTDAPEAGADAHGLRRCAAARPLVGGFARPARRHRPTAGQRDRRRRGARGDRACAEVALGVLLATLRGRVRTGGRRQRQSVHGSRRARVPRGCLPRGDPRARFVAADAARHGEPRTRAQLPDLADRRCREGAGDVDAERGAAGRRALRGADRAAARRARDRGVGLQATLAAARQRARLARRRPLAGRHGDAGGARAARRAAGARRARAARGDGVPARDGGFAGHGHGSDRPRGRHPPRQPGLLPDDRLARERARRPRPALSLLAGRPAREPITASCPPRSPARRLRADSS